MDNTTNKKSANLLIGDNHKIVRDGIRAILKEESDLEIVGETSSAKELLDLCAGGSIDLIIVDLDLLLSSRMNLLATLQESYPNIKILALSSRFCRNNLKKIVHAEVDGLILKKSGKQVLLKALKTILSGQKYYGHEITEQVIQNYVGSKSTNGRNDPHALTQRESEILNLICQEYTNQEIADKLHISVRTVDAHRRNLLQKTGARNTAGLVRFAMEHKLG